jgi:transposase, IS5 family
MSRTPDLQVSFADVEFMRQGVFLDPTLQTISDFLDQHEEMIAKVRGDLERGLKNPRTGRHGLTPPQVLRSLVLMRFKSWDYRELRERIQDGYTLRLFTDFRSQPVPQHQAFNRAFNRLTPETLRTINQWVVRVAVGLGLEDGQKLRVDTTVVETDIHHPADNTLRWDTVRVLTRLVGQLAQTLGRRLKAFHNRTRAARRRMYILQRLTPSQRHQQQTKIYRQLMAVTEEVVANARRVVKQTEKARPKSLPSEATLRSLRSEIGRYGELGERVIDQTRRRVLEAEQVPSTEKVYSIFEPHTDLIKRGKAENSLEFGHKVFLAESAQGLITQYEVLSGNPHDEIHVQPSLQHHGETFGHPPHLYGSDRGFYSRDNVQACQRCGVQLVCIPQCGGKKTPRQEAYEKSAAFKKGQRFRAGIEGRISVLFRGRGMKRCRAQGRQRFELLVGAAVLTNNLMRIAALLTSSSSRKKRPAA